MTAEAVELPLLAKSEDRPCKESIPSQPDECAKRSKESDKQILFEKMSCEHQADVKQSTETVGSTESGQLLESDLQSMRSHRLQPIAARSRHKLNPIHFKRKISHTRMATTEDETPPDGLNSGNSYNHSNHQQGNVMYCAEQHQHPVFVEMHTLEKDETDDARHYFRETARWVHFEEDVNPVTKEFGQAHSPPLSLMAVRQFEYCLLTHGLCMLDVIASDKFVLTQIVIDSLLNNGRCSDDESTLLRQILLLHHLHVGEKVSKQMSRRYSSKKMPETDKRQPASSHDVRELAVAHRNLTDNVLDQHVTHHETCKESATHASTTTATPALQECNSPGALVCPHFVSKLKGKLKPGTESVSVQVGYLDGISRPVIVLVRLAVPCNLRGITELEDIPMRFLFICILPIGHYVDCVEVGRVFSSVMIEPDFRRKAYKAHCLQEIIQGFQEYIGRCIIIPFSRHITPSSLAAMYPQIKQFKQELESRQHVLHRAEPSSASFTNRGHVGHAGDAVSELQGKKISECPPSMQSCEDRLLLETGGVDGGAGVGDNEVTPPTMAKSIGMSARRERIAQCFRLPFCPPFSLLFSDLNGYRTRLVSDFVDAFRPVNRIGTVFITIIFIYFTCLSPVVTFGSLLGNLNERYTVSSVIMASGVSQMIFALIGGQPLTVIGHTGPTFIIETATSLFSKSANLRFESLHFFLCLYTSVFGLIFLFFNAMLLTSKIRRSVEEIFNAFIGTFFIIKALINIFRLYDHGDIVPYYDSRRLSNMTQVYFQICSNLSDASCLKLTNSTKLVVTEAVEQRTYATVVLACAFGMFFISYSLASLKRGVYFTHKIRMMLGCLNVPIGIAVVTIFSLTFFDGYNLPTLSIPSELRPSEWISLINFTELKEDMQNVTLHIYALLLAGCLSVIVFTEVALSGITMAKAERKLQKPLLFSQDLFVISVLLPLLHSFLGWPIMNAAVVRATTHVIALTLWDRKTPPGVAPKVIGVIEQRVSGICVGFLVLISVATGFLLRYIPTAAMLGMFVYMGVMQLRDLSITRRIMALMKKKKYWKSCDSPENIPKNRLVVFTIIAGLVALLLILLDFITTVSRIPYASLLFPVILLLYALAREFLMPRCHYLAPYLENIDKRHPIVLRASVKKPVILASNMMDAADRGSVINGAKHPPMMDGQETALAGYEHGVVTSHRGVCNLHRPDSYATVILSSHPSASFQQEAIRHNEMLDHTDVPTVWDIGSSCSTDESDNAIMEHLLNLDDYCDCTRYVRNAENPYPH